VATEKIFKRFHKFFKKIFPALLIIGVTLPTLHQSSLGELFWVLPGKMHPLWYTPIIFLFFLMTSFAVGPAMIALEGRLASRGLNHKVDLKVINGLIKISGVVLGIYFVLKMGDLAVRGQLGTLFAGTVESNLFVVEMLLILIPVCLVIANKTATNAGQIWFGCLVVAGVVLNRFNMMTALHGYMNEAAPGSSYIPAVGEVAISVGLVCMACLVYLFIAENFVIVKHEKASEPARQEISVSGKTEDHTVGA
jgi:Ni/Fe-hydrogenase subunit HybB-like protein